MKSVTIRCFSLLLILSGPVANAQTPDGGAAREHFDAGLKHLDAGDYARALSEFSAARTLSDNPKITLNMATTLRQLGRLPQAANAYAEYLRHPQRDPARVVEVERVLAQLDAQVGRIVVTAPADSVVTIDGTQLPNASGGTLVHRAIPGSHRVVAEKRDCSPATTTLELAPGTEVRVALEPTPQGHAASTPSLSTPFPSISTAAPDRADAERAPASEARPERLGFFVRADIDGKARGAVIAPGVSYKVSKQVDLAGAALLGRHQGAWVGARARVLNGPFSPAVLLGAPLFFVDGVRPGVHGAVGAVWDPSRHIGFSLDIGVAHFFSPPTGYEATVFVPSLGLQARL